ncbi:hypothetical protein [Sporosarcina globispora]|uniref:hypothetical protein n=1 Tax=Sporosarcina globispora TaxID=1459 RepID=UPI000AE2396C|nr:hypothetical protein [Sporosarcina globispora]
MLGKESHEKLNQLFLDMLTKAYEMGVRENEMSVSQLLLEIENDLRKIVEN